MKDFYDIYYLSRTFDFDGLKLQTALQETLQNRGTAYGAKSFDRILSLAEEEDMQVKWRYFLRTLGDPALPFQDIIGGIQRFLAPVWDEFLKQREFLATWKAAQASWSIRLPEEKARKTETD